MKLHLTINSGTLAGQDFELESGFLTIGRGETCSIRFDPMSERIASKQHAFIEARADGFFVTDNKSTNGTLVNGVPVESAKLNNGDEIRFGKNGNTATVEIDTFADELRPEAADARFEQQQPIGQYQQALPTGSVSIQASLSQLGLGNAAAVDAHGCIPS